MLHWRVESAALYFIKSSIKVVSVSRRKLQSSPIHASGPLKVQLGLGVGLYWVCGERLAILPKHGRPQEILPDLS